MSRKLRSQKSEGFEEIDDYSPERTPQRPIIQPSAQQTPVRQPPSSQHEDEQQVNDPQQATNQDDDISDLRSPAVKGEEVHPFQPDSSVQVTASLAEAIMLMTAELRRRDPPSSSSKRAKTKEPDTFDGSDPKKLNNFILLCNLYFRQNSAYSNDAAKINFALSHLRGIALEYFEPSVIDSDNYPAWMDNWSAFVLTLRTQFGPIDPAGDAENSIDHLKMQDNQRIVKYNVEFNRLAIHTGWDENVLRHRYYTGLAERIKDIMGHQPKPATLDAMKLLAHTIDARHWERIREKSRSGKSKSDDKADDKTDKGKKSDDKGKSNASNIPGPSHNNNNNNSNNSKGNKNSNNNKPNKASSSSASTNPLADKLGKDGKLTQQERQRRLDNNLCLFCGGPGHTAANCNKASSAAAKAKARAAQAKEKDPPAGDSKKA